MHLQAEASDKIWAIQEIMFLKESACRLAFLPGKWYFGASNLKP